MYHQNPNYSAKNYSSFKMKTKQIKLNQKKKKKSGHQLSNSTYGRNWRTRHPILNLAYSNHSVTKNSSTPSFPPSTKCSKSTKSLSNNNS